MSDLKLCRDCKHANVGTFISCRHPQNMAQNLVEGGMKSLQTPGFLREHDCGVEGKWFEPIEATVIA